MERQTNDGTKAVAVLAIAHLSLLWTTSASSIGRLAVCNWQIRRLNAGCRADEEDLWSRHTTHSPSGVDGSNVEP